MVVAVYMKVNEWFDEQMCAKSQTFIVLKKTSIIVYAIHIHYNRSRPNIQHQISDIAPSSPM